MYLSQLIFFLIVSDVISTCLHLFCRTCVLQHTLVCVEDRKIPIKCPEKECNEVLTQMEIKYLLENLQDKFDLYLKLELQLCGDFVKGLHACPRQDCPGMVEGSRPNTRELALCPVNNSRVPSIQHCRCARWNSVQCAKRTLIITLHLVLSIKNSKDYIWRELLPVTPVLLKRRSNRKVLLVFELFFILQAEAASLKIIREQFVPCPKCFSPIEKNAGCAHMTCTRCGQE